MYWLIDSLKVYQSDGVLAVAVAPKQQLVLSKNETLPLLTTPLAVGGSVTPMKRKRGGGLEALE